MASVDDRIVAMKFDNAVFQQKVADTIKSMDDLKKSLDVSNANKGLQELDRAGKSFSLDGMASAIEGISGKFTAMGAIAFSVLQNVTTMAMHAGAQLVKGLSLDQIIGGYQEYETNLNSIQTILANTSSKGSTLDDVNKALDQLNTYSDQTIYNFSQMARNIGTFTAAGVNLDTSVGAIKGIANLAAVSGSNAEQASTAMYQLSQALASGSVKLMDWNSVVNAGMGGEVFQKALFNTGKALGTIKDVPMAQTFDQWKDAGNTFRDSLQDGWITADVLTSTLSQFTGDLTDAQVKAMGFTDEQVAQIQQMAKTAKGAATEVKTFTQLISTVKESIGSGWSTTFRTIFGDFNEAKTLFTDINTTIGGFVSANADARNKVLGDWKALGGRTQLIEGLKAGFEALISVAHTISGAFRDIFPAMTGTRLVQLTVEFKNFMEALKPSPATVVLLTRIFRGLFSALSIGWNVIKGTVGFFKDLFDFFKSQDTDPNHGLLGFLAGIGDKLTALQTALVGGGGIINFFHNLEVAVIRFIQNFDFQHPFAAAMELFQKFRDFVWGIFSGGIEKLPDGVTDALGRMGDRLGWLKTVAEALGKVWDFIISHLDDIRTALGNFLGWIRDKFSNIPQLIADAFANVNYDSALSTIDVGLFGGLVLMFKKFLSSDKLDFSGIIDKIKGTFDTLTDTLSAMQTKLKADALKSIAIAVGILVAALVVLSLIDSEALTRGFTAMAVGFGMLVTAMGLLNQVISSQKDAAKLGLMATGLIIFAGAMLIFSVAAKIFSTMNWEELARGMTSIGILMGAIAGFMKILPDSKSLISTGIGLTLLATGMSIMAGAVKLFSMMSWDELAHGMAGVGASLAVIAGFMHLLPDKASMMATGAGLILISIGLLLMSKAVQSFGSMDWGMMGKGMAGIAGALLIIAGAMHLMPGPEMVLTAAGLLLVGIALNLIAKAMQSIAGMSWGEIAKGLVGIAGALVVLSFGLAGMAGAIPGAIAIAIVALVLGKLADGLKKFAALKWSELLKGLVGLAAIFAVLAVAALLMEPVIPALLALGAALILVGAGIALLGLGANLLASAFAIIATAGTQGVKTLSEALQVLIDALPSFIGAFADGMLMLAAKILEALPAIITGLDGALKALIQLLIDNIPGLVAAGVELIKALIGAITDLIPDIIQLGFDLLMGLLRGIRDNIKEIVTVVVEIITQFIDGLTANIELIVASGLALLVAFLKGISDNLTELVAAVGGIITKFVEEIGNQAQSIIDAGKDFILKVIEGFGKAVKEIGDAIVQMAADFSAQCVVWADKLLQAGKDFILGILAAASKATLEIADGMFTLITNFLNGLADVINKRAPELREAGLNIVKAIINGITGFDASGLLGKAAETLAGMVTKPFKAILGIFSPSRVFLGYAGEIIAGLALGLQKTDPATSAAEDMAVSVIDAFQTALGQIPVALDGMSDFQPTITPVLDLTNVQKGASQIGGILGQPAIPATNSLQQATLLSLQQRPTDEEDATAPAQPKEVTYIQNNYSPEALSTADIYRATRSQIAMAKEELAVA